LTVEEIAQKKLGLSTIMSHLAKLYVDGAEIDLIRLSQKKKFQIADAQIKLESPNALKPYFDYFEEK
jgi:ATP-dependent DNA helicase RecQ